MFKIISNEKAQVFGVTVGKSRVHREEARPVSATLRRSRSSTCAALRLRIAVDALAGRQWSSASQRRREGRPTSQVVARSPLREASRRTGGKYKLVFANVGLFVRLDLPSRSLAKATRHKQAKMQLHPCSALSGIPATGRWNAAMAAIAHAGCGWSLPPRRHHPLNDLRDATTRLVERRQQGRLVWEACDSRRGGERSWSSARWRDRRRLQWRAAAIGRWR